MRPTGGFESVKCPRIWLDQDPAPTKAPLHDDRVGFRNSVERTDLEECPASVRPIARPAKVPNREAVLVVRRSRVLVVAGDAVVRTGVNPTALVPPPAGCEGMHAAPRLRSGRRERQLELMALNVADKRRHRCREIRGDEFVALRETEKPHSAPSCHMCHVLVGSTGPVVFLAARHTPGCCIPR